MKYIWRNRILLVVMILVVVLFPNIIALPQQSRTENIITAMGIDKNDDGYEVFIQYVVPYAKSEKDTLKIMSGKGATVGEAIENMDTDYGKNSGFAHCRALIFNDKACEDNLTDVLDYLLRIKTNTSDILLVNTKESSGKVLESVTSLDSEFYTIVNSNSIANEQRKYQDLKSIGDYYNAEFGKSKAIAINVIDLESKGENKSGGTSSGGGESNDASGGAQTSSEEQTQSQAQKIKNDNELAIIKNGKKIANLSKEQSQCLAWFDSAIKEAHVQVHNFTDGVYKNADMNFYVYNKSGFVGVDFVDGVPTYTLNLKVYLRTAQILQSGTATKIYEVDKKKWSDKLKFEISKSIKNELMLAEQDFKTKDYDVVRCNEFFYKFHPYKYRDYLKTLPATDSFIKNVKFVYNVQVVQRL